MRIVVYSNVRLFCETLAICLVNRDRIEEATPCYRATQIQEVIVKKRPDVVLFDVSNEQVLPELRALNRNSFTAPILVMGIPETPEKVLSCAEAGMDGYIPRQSSVEDVLYKIEMALRGECGCDPKIAGHLFRKLRDRRTMPPATDLVESLTHREREVLREIAKGHSNKQIARELVLSVATVKNHVHNIFSKLHVNSRAEVLAKLRDEPWRLSAV